MRGPERFTTDRARSLRKVENDAEAALWSELRNRRLNGFKFVRQEPINRYFVDFANRERRLVIELDGSQHAGSAYDEMRDTTLLSEGWSVLRFWNADALVARESVLETILAALEQRLDRVIDAPDLRFRAAAGYGRSHSDDRAISVEVGTAPHPYPLPVKDGERASPALKRFSPRPSRGDDQGEGHR